MSEEFLEAMRQADALTPAEQMRLISHLIQQLSRCEIKRKQSRKLTEFIGMAPNHVHEIWGDINGYRPGQQFSARIVLRDNSSITSTL